MKAVMAFPGAEAWRHTLIPGFTVKQKWCEPMIWSRMTIRSSVSVPTTTVSDNRSRNLRMGSYAYSSSDGPPIDDMAMPNILCVSENRAVTSSFTRYPCSANEQRMRYSEVLGVSVLAMSSARVSPCGYCDTISNNSMPLASMGMLYFVFSVCMGRCSFSFRMKFQMRNCSANIAQIFHSVKRNGRIVNYP